MSDYLPVIEGSHPLMCAIIAAIGSCMAARGRHRCAAPLPARENFFNDRSAQTAPQM
ncbi:MAG: hypothetical protein AAFV09_13340 [Pseudomonadota bacterium]